MSSPYRTYDHIAALVHPIETDTVTVRAGDPGAAADALADYVDAVQDARARLAQRLEAGHDAADVDPVLAVLAQLAAERDAADERIRRIIAFAREFLPPRAYTLEQLAKAAGMSSSGVDTAYGRPRTRANPIIEYVAETTGVTPRSERNARTPADQNRRALDAVAVEMRDADGHKTGYKTILFDTLPHLEPPSPSSLRPNQTLHRPDHGLILPEKREADADASWTTEAMPPITYTAAEADQPSDD